MPVGGVAEWSIAPVLKTCNGRVAEWSIAAVLKTADVQASVGSNPTPSATCPRESILPIRLRSDFSVVFEGYAGAAEHWRRRQEARKRSLRVSILRTS